MTRLQTIVKLTESNTKIDYKSNLLFIGSCFSNNIGDKLANLKINTLVNPFGVMYNPLSVKSCLDIILNNQTFTEDKLRQSNGLWFSYCHHSIFSSADKTKVLEDINTAIGKANQHLKNTNILFITLGTARVYYLKENNQLVANCHKQPAKLFNHELLDVNEIVEAYSGLIKKLKAFNPQLKIIFTISPIRHWKDGAFENQVSKSTLFLSVQKLMNVFEGIEYFPAYEIFMDELRDYRFYADDMLHPSSLGVEYVWNRFVEYYIKDKETKSYISEMTNLNKALNHRPLNQGSDEFNTFLKNTSSKISTLEKKYKGLSLKEEKEQIKKYNNKINKTKTSAKK